MSCDKRTVVTSAAAEKCCEAQLQDSIQKVASVGSFAEDIRAHVAANEAVYADLGQPPPPLTIGEIEVILENTYAESMFGYTPPTITLVDGRTIRVSGPLPRVGGSPVGNANGKFGTTLAAAMLLVAGELIRRKLGSKTKKGDCCSCLELEQLSQLSKRKWLTDRHRTRKPASGAIG